MLDSILSSFVLVIFSNSALFKAWSRGVVRLMAVCATHNLCTTMLDLARANDATSVIQGQGHFSRALLTMVVIFRFRAAISFTLAALYRTRDRVSKEHHTIHTPVDPYRHITVTIQPYPSTWLFARPSLALKALCIGLSLGLLSLGPLVLSLQAANDPEVGAPTTSTWYWIPAELVACFACVYLFFRCHTKPAGRGIMYTQQRLLIFFLGCLTFFAGSLWPTLLTFRICCWSFAKCAPSSA